MVIKILGSLSCNSCKKLEQNTRAALSDLGLEAEVIKVTSTEDILKYDVFVLPGLVVDEKLLYSGKVLKPKEIAKLLS